VSRVTRPALRGTLLGRVLRFLNPLVRRLLASRLHWPLSRWLALLSWERAATGRRRTLPVSYIRERPVAYLTTGERWSADFGTSAPVALRLGGRWYRHAEAVREDQAEAAIVLRRLFAEHEWFRVLAGVPSSRSGGANPRAVDMALSAGRALVRVTLAPRQRAKGLRPA
jgi:hypothetical protein